MSAGMTTRSSPRGSGAPMLVACLIVMAAMVALVTSGAGLFHVFSAARDGEITVGVILAAIACVVAGLGLACLLWAAAWMVAARQELLTRQRRMLSILTDGQAAPGPDCGPLPASPPARASDDGELLERVLAELKQLKLDMMLPPAELKDKLRREQEQWAGELVGRFEEAVAAGHLAEADKALADFVRAFPDDPRGAELRARVPAARQQEEAEDISGEVRRAEDLMALTDFGSAEEVAEALALAHRSSAQAGALLERVRRERRAFELQQRRELYAQIERHVEGRRWREAVDAAGKLLAMHHDCPEAKMVASRMAMLEDNARIEEVRGIRDEICGLIGRRRYAEAISLGEEVIERYPDTVAAADLRRQLPRLAELGKPGRGGISSETQYLGDILAELADPEGPREA